MALVGNVYIQASSVDPGAVGYGYEWAQTDTGNIYVRNVANSAWVIKGNTDQTYLGNLNRGGGTMTGPITGAHGLAPLSGADFTTPPTINGNTIPTKDYVDTRDNYVLSQISTQVAAAIAAMPGVSITDNMVVWTGTVAAATTWSDPLVIPITRTYPDGTTILKTDCQSFASMNFASVPINSGSSFSFTLNQVDNMTWQAYTIGGPSSTHTAASINYIVIAIKPGS